MANPLMAAYFSSEKVSNAGNIYNESIHEDSVAKMTTGGTLNKSFLLLGLVFLAGIASWMAPIAITTTSIFSVVAPIVAVIVALIASFKPKTARYLAPIFAIAQGLFLGVISKLYNYMFAEESPNIVATAIVITLLTTFLMFIMQKHRILRVASKYKKMLFLAIGAIAIYYLVTFIIHLCGGDTSYFTSGSLISVGISVLVVGVASFTLILDFQTIENATKIGVPKYMEWFGALTLMITIVWLYFEILILLSKLAKRK